MTSLSIFFDAVFLSRVTSSDWSKFHANTITGSGGMTISFYKTLTRNPEIGNTPVWVLPNIRGLGWVRNTKFGTNISNKMALNAGKCQGYSFYHFWVMTENQWDEGGKICKSYPLINKQSPNLLLIFRGNFCMSCYGWLLLIIGAILVSGVFYRNCSFKIWFFAKYRCSFNFNNFNKVFSCHLFLYQVE